jgi:phage baseplate assembly protein W
MKYINIKFPIEDDSINNFFIKRNRTTKESLLSNLTLLLLTNKWERYFNPLYGSDLLRFVFEPNDNIVSTQLETEIRDIVKKYIPKINVNNIEFIKPDENKEYSLEILINFTYTDDVYTERDTLQINI